MPFFLCYPGPQTLEAAYHGRALGQVKSGKNLYFCRSTDLCYLTLS